MATEFDPHIRGDHFKLIFTLGNDWVGTSFEDVKFTLRKLKASSVRLNDRDAIDQASVGSGEITFDIVDNNIGIIEINSRRTRTWPLGKLAWDLEGTVGSGSLQRKYTIDYGTIKIIADATRS